MSKDASADVLARLRPSDFYRPGHCTIYEAILDLYGKGERPDRKIGHVNIVGAVDQGVEDVRERAERAAHWMSRAEWTDGWDPHS